MYDALLPLTLVRWIPAAGLHLTCHWAASVPWQPPDDLVFLPSHCLSHLCWFHLCQTDFRQKASTDVCSLFKCSETFFLCVCVCVLLSFACCWRKARVYCRVVRPPALSCCAWVCTGLPLHLSWMLCQPVPSNHVPCCWAVLHSAEIVPREKGLIGIFHIRSGQEFPR